VLWSVWQPFASVPPLCAHSAAPVSAKIVTNAAKILVMSTLHDCG
jgi:hypothetical protein